MFNLKHLLLFVAAFISVSCFSQGLNDTVDIFSRLKYIEQGEGTVNVIQDASLDTLVGRYAKVLYDEVSGQRYIEIPGWRIQVYSDNNQRYAKKEAFERQQMVKKCFPDISNYIEYKAPFWRYRIGDFQTYDEACVVFDKLCKNLRNYSKGMSIVKDMIKVIIK